RSVSPDLAVIDLMTCNEQIDRGLLLPQMYAEVAALFGLLGLVVAVAGLFGLLSYSVSLRGREMGIRMAVGAQPADIRRLIVRQGMALVAAGVVLGLAAALPLSHILASLLFGVEPLDPITFAAVPVLLLLVSLLACLLPARRAARLDPSAMLRSL
ncbi:MAG TPA: FtsX-like permease family protein, partial [Thermoanaerobaculia bacterium]